jgi:ketosteroid isomerase-like protein
MKRLPAIACALAALWGSSAFASSEDDVRSTVERFVAAQNALDLGAVRSLLADSPTFLWITRGNAIWGTEPALKRFESLYQGTWKLSPDMSGLKVMMLSDTAAQIYVPILFTIGASGQAASDSMFLMNQTLTKGATGWRIASILPILGPAAPPAAAK